MNRFSLQYDWRTLIYRIIWYNLGRYLFSLLPNRLFVLKNRLLQLYGAKIGKGVRVYSSALIHFPRNLELGDFVVIGRCVEIKNHKKLVVGERSTISQGARLIDSTHDFKDDNFSLHSKAICIKTNVWIAQEAFVGPGVTLDNNVVLGARSVCFKSLKEGVYVGNPIRAI